LASAVLGAGVVVEAGAVVEAGVVAGPEATGTDGVLASAITELDAWATAPAQ